MSSSAPRASPARDERFPREHRLTRGAEFEAVLARGRRAHGQYFVVHALLQERPTSRLGLTVSRRVGNAVVRHRVKRRLRELFRRELRRELDAPGAAAVDLVVRARPEAADATFAELRVDLLDTALAAARRARAGTDPPAPRRQARRP